MIPEEFYAGFIVYSVFYFGLLFLLVVQYGSMNDWIWYMVAQSLYVTIVMTVRLVAPEFVKKHGKEKIMMLVKPSIFASEALNMFGLGMTRKEFSDQNADYAYVFALLAFLKILEATSLALVSKNSSFFDSKSGTKAEKTGIWMKSM
jgi:hypothetical protein